MSVLDLQFTIELFGISVLSKTPEVFMQLGDIKTRGVEVIDMNASLQEAAAKIEESSTSHWCRSAMAKPSKARSTERDITIRAIADGY